MRSLWQQTVWTACITPLHASGAVDHSTLARLVRRLEAAGHGVVLLGSTGEALSLSWDEKCAVLATVCDLKLTVPVMVGVPGSDLITAQAWVAWCAKQPVQALLVPTPLYTKPGPQGQVAWFEALLADAQQPVMAYNIPSRAGVALAPEVLRHPKIEALKESSGSLDAFMTYQVAAPDVAVFAGDDVWMPAMMAQGASGLISVLGNAWPDGVSACVAACQQGVWSSEQSGAWWALCGHLACASNPVPIKAVMAALGLVVSAQVRLPLSVKDVGADPVVQAVQAAQRCFFREKTSIQPQALDKTGCLV